MSSIFISYRRSDTAGEAGRLGDRLVSRFGRPRVFMDVDAMEPGLDFVEVIEEHIGKCSVLIVLVGRSWLEKDAQGNRRIDDPDDFHRLEIDAALKRGIRVIPVLVQGATMPAESALPDALKKFARRHALEISATRWDYDVNQLFEVVERILKRDSESVAPPKEVTEGSFDTGVVEAALHAIDTVGVDKLRQRQQAKRKAETEANATFKKLGQQRLKTQEVKPPASAKHVAVPPAETATLPEKSPEPTPLEAPKTEAKPEPRPEAKKANPAITVREKAAPIVTKDEPPKPAESSSGIGISGIGMKIAGAVAGIAAVLAFALWPASDTENSAALDTIPEAAQAANQGPDSSAVPAIAPDAEPDADDAAESEESSTPPAPIPPSEPEEQAAAEPEPPPPPAPAAIPAATPAAAQVEPEDDPVEVDVSDTSAEPPPTVAAATAEPDATTETEEADPEPEPELVSADTEVEEPSRVPASRGPAPSGLRGTFRDQAGNGAGVTVRLVEATSGEMLETTTADDGTYRIFPLPGGAYDISFIRGDEVLYERPEPLSIPEGDFVTFGITFEPADEPQ